MKETLQTLALAAIEQAALTSFHDSILDFGITCEDYVESVFKDKGLNAHAVMDPTYNVPGTLRFTSLPEPGSQPRLELVIDCIRPEHMTADEFGCRYREALSFALDGLVKSQDRLSFPYGEKETHYLDPKHAYSEYKSRFQLRLSA